VARSCWRATERPLCGESINHTGVVHSKFASMRFQRNLAPRANNLFCTRELAANKCAHPAHTTERFFSFTPFRWGGTLSSAFYEEEARAPKYTASPKHPSFAFLVSSCMWLMNEADSIYLFSLQMGCINQNRLHRAHGESSGALALP